MDVASLVKSITSAFEDASNLVKRIRKRKENDPNAQLEPIDDLIESLTLGSTFVRRCYESDAKRFGAIYAAGDSLATGELKDALINLQSTVLHSLGAVFLDDKDPDYDAIQGASDECRSDVNICLGQLSKRISKAAKVVQHVETTPAHDNESYKSPQRSDSHSTQSSAPPRAMPMTPPESETDFPGDMNINTPNGRPTFVPRAPDLDAMAGMHRASYQNLYPSNTSVPAEAPFGFQRAPMMPAPMGPQSPVSPQELLIPNPLQIRDSTSTTSSQGHPHNSYYAQSNQDGPGRNESPNNNPNTWGYFTQSPTERTQSLPYRDLTAATLGKPRSPSDAPPFVGRKPVTSTYASSTGQSQSTAPPPSYRNSIPEDDGKEVVFTPPTPNRTMSLQTGPYNRNASYASSGVLSRSGSLAVAPSGPLSLPTEKNLMGYCKGALRLQAGMDKKAFVLAYRPLGYTTSLQYWRCDKCNFEGQCQAVVPPGGKKADKVFDPVIRDHGSIRYRWAFIAKCHVPLKSLPQGRRDGLYGGFCCIFCTAEAAQRGWPSLTSNAAGDRMSVKSGSSGSTGNGNMAVFGNIHSFMDHLDMHRQPEFWPGVEMQIRMKCVVGRIAQRGEEFDINLMPDA